MKNRESISSTGIDKLIIGAGNILLSDEGIGLHVLKELQRLISSDAGPAEETKKEFYFLKHTGFVDIGTSSIDIGLYLADNIKKMVIIDCIKAEGYEPGTVFKLGIEDLRKRQSENFSLHQLELVDSLKVISITETLPEILIFGIVPAQTEIFSLELSETLKQRFPLIIDKILKEINIFFSVYA
ncbi:MAG: hydrogenase maturation protease [Actinobacteria bacterium]|nr:hydrogenase maturation protease [Actinomycetota bacterium]